MLTIREKPPLRHHIEVASPSGLRARWATDEPNPENAHKGLRFSSTMPGGFESLDVTLPRKAARDYGDLEELETLRVRAAGGEIVGEYRLQATPRSSGDELHIAPAAVGWQSHLDDDQSAREIFIDADLSRWGAMSNQLRIAGLGLSYGMLASPEVKADATTGTPQLRTGWDGAWSGAKPLAAGWYDAQGIPLGSVYYAWQRENTNGTVMSPANVNWTWLVRLAPDADTIGAGSDETGNLRAAGPDTGTLTATTSSRIFASADLSFEATTGGADGVIYGILWRLLVFGRHGLTKRGSGLNQGLHASDVVAYTVDRWAPKLAFTTGAGGTIQPSSFVIPQLAFLDPTTASEIVRQASRFELPDWAVWEGPTFYWNERGLRGRTWRARVGPAQLQETGPSIDRLWNSVVVRYQDVTGQTRTVGPAGSGANTTSSLLVDSDPANPATIAGVTRRALLAMGTSTAAGAIQVGAQFLAYQKIISTAGQARLVGHVEDDRGVLWPASRVRAGDSIVFTDAADPTTERRIVRADYSDDDKACSIDLDAPPDALQALLERLSVVLVPLGQS